MIGGILNVLFALFPCGQEPIDWEAKRRADGQRTRRMDRTNFREAGEFGEGATVTSEPPRKA